MIKRHAIKTNTIQRAILDFHKEGIMEPRVVQILYKVVGNAYTKSLPTGHEFMSPDEIKTDLHAPNSIKDHVNLDALCILFETLIIENSEYNIQSEATPFKIIKKKNSFTSKNSAYGFEKTEEALEAFEKSTEDSKDKVTNKTLEDSDLSSVFLKRIAFLDSQLLGAMQSLLNKSKRMDPTDYENKVTKYLKGLNIAIDEVSSAKNFDPQSLKRSYK